MKTNIFKFLIFMGLAAIVGCSDSANGLQRKYDPVEAMRLPENPQKVRPVISQDLIEPQGQEDPREVIDISALPKTMHKSIEKNIRVTGDNVIMRKGPGVQFEKLGVANKNETFKYLRTVPSPSGGPSWHWVEDNAENKLYISSQDSEVLQISGESDQKISLQKGEPLTPSQFRSALTSTPPLPPELKKAKHITLNFEGTEIYDVITTFCELMKIDYLIEGDVSGKITLRTFNNIPVKDLFSVFEQILAVNNISVVKSGKFYRFLPMKEAKKKPLSLYYGNDSKIPQADRLIIQLIPLKHLTPAAAKKVITPLLSANAILIDIPDTKSLMLVELASSVKQVLKILQALDIDRLSTSDIQLYKIQYSDAQEVADEMNEIFTSIGYGSSLGETLTFLPLTRLNSLLVVNAISDIRSVIDFWVGKLDHPFSTGQTSTFVYYVQHADAETLATLLSSIYEQKDFDSKADPFKSLTTQITKKKDTRKKKTKTTKTTKVSVKPNKNSYLVKGGLQGEFEGDINIFPDKDTNSLVIRTNPRNYPAILELIKKLDLQPQQVLIEVLILDLTLDEETLTGLEFAMQGTSGDYFFGGGSAPGLSTLGSQIGSVTSLFAPGASFFVQNRDKMIATLQAFASDSKVNIVANPILVTSNNKQASISIVDDIPIESTVITSTGAINPLTETTIEFRDVGVKLDILPKINSNNYVSLKINQEISNLGPIFQNTPSFTTRTITTEVVLKDNEVLVMGGLMRSTATETIEGIPWLKDIPYLGWLFSTRGTITKKTELMLFITPHIISNASDSNFITDQFKKKLGNLKEKLQSISKAEAIATPDPGPTPSNSTLTETR